MPPKRQSRLSTPPSVVKRSKKSKSAQKSIDSFFFSPTKPKRDGAEKQERQKSVINFVDSDEEPSTPTRYETNSIKKLGSGCLESGNSKKVDKGKARESSSVFDEDEIGQGDDVIPVGNPIPKSRGVIGSSSRSHLQSARLEKEAGSKRDTKPVASGTSPPFDTRPDVQSPSTPSKLSAITSTSAERVDAIDFDLDAFLFRPSDVDVSRWPRGRLPYSVLVGVYVQVSSTRSRLTIVRVLTNFLHLLLHASPIDLPPCLYLLSNHLLPSYLPCELGIGGQILSKAIQEVSGLQSRDLKRLWEKWGDPGDVAFEAKSNLRTLVRPSPLLVGDVYDRLLGLSRIKGTQSGRVKLDVVRKLMVQARGQEVRFLVRSLGRNLRIGAVRLTLLTSLARATALLHMPSDLIDSVRPIPPPHAKAEKGQKRTTRPKIEPDPARDEVEARCMEAMKIVRKVYVRHPNYGDLVRGLDKGGLDGLDDRVRVSVGIPLSPMLGSITRSLSEVFTRLGSLPFTAEAKLDGQRVQIHARLDGPQGEDDGGGRWVQSDDGIKVWVRLFSRHLEDMTEKYPDVCRLCLTLLARTVPASPSSFPKDASMPQRRLLDLLHASSIKSFIIDAEIVAVDKDNGAHRTFQELSNRAKKDVRVEDIKVVVGVFAFDLMLLNDSTLLDSPFSHRRHLLHTLFPPFADTDDPLLARFAHIEHLDSTNCTDVAAEMQAFFEGVVEQKCEGLMVKLLESGEGITGEDEEDDDIVGSSGKKGKGKDKGGKKKPLPATYEPDQRSQGWLKVKKDYLEGLGDSLDLVPIGGWWGQGRKAGWWSPILLACHNPETGALEAVCKCISGFTDAFYKDLLVRYPPEGKPEKCSKHQPLGYYETNGLRPDVWFQPSEVWEIRGADITLSPVYPAAASLLGSERGLSVRFPRFMKIRDDKGWEQATTADQFAEMYRKQIKEAPSRVKAKPGEVVIRDGSEEVPEDADGEEGDATGEEEPDDGSEG